MPEEDYPQSLFDGSPPHNSTDTSIAASDKVKTKTVRERVADLIWRSGDKGMTCGEIEKALHRSSGTITARINELCKLNEIKDSGRRRKSEWNVDARVYITNKKPVQERFL